MRFPMSFVVPQRRVLCRGSHSPNGPAATDRLRSGETVRSKIIGIGFTVSSEATSMQNDATGDNMSVVGMSCNRTPIVSIHAVLW